MRKIIFSSLNKMSKDIIIEISKNTTIEEMNIISNA